MEPVPARCLEPEGPGGARAFCFLDRRPTGSRRRLYAVGDVGFCGRLSPHGRDPWLEVGPTLRRGDAVFANLETPLSSEVSASPFIAPLASADLLVAGGLSVVNLANNHIADAGPAGILSTLEALEDVGIASFGAGRDPAAARRMAVIDLAGLRVGWLGCARTLQNPRTDGPAFWELDALELCEAVRRCRDEVDVLVVSIHLGYMYVDYPHPDHRRLTLDLAAAGADLVLAHHAHVVQGIEVVEDTVICHNLGNFLFDWTAGEVPVDLMIEEQRRGVIVAVDLDRRGICRLAALPTRVDDGWTVRWAAGETGDAILERLARISRDLAGDYAAEFRRQRAERNTGPALRTILHRLRRGELRVIPETLRQLRPHHLAMAVRWLARRVFGSVM